MATNQGTNGGSNGLLVRFYLDSIPDAKASAEHGTPKFRDVPFVEIAVPGDKDNIIRAPAWLDEGNPASHSNRFPSEWAHFKSGMDGDAPVGTPLKEWPQVTRSQVEELAYVKVRTVEQLASVSDTHLNKLGMGMQALRQKARDFLQAAKDAAPAAALAAELAKRDEVIAQLQAQMAAFSKAAEPKGKFSTK